MVGYYSTQPFSVATSYSQQPYRTRYVFADNYRSNVSVGQPPIRQIRSNRSSGNSSGQASLLSNEGRQRPRTTVRFNEMPSLNYRELYNKAVMKNSGYRRDETKQRSYWPERRDNLEWHTYPSSSRQGFRFTSNRHPASLPKRDAPYRDLITRPYERRGPPIRRLAAGGSDHPDGLTRHRFNKPLLRLVDTFPTLQRTRTKHEAAKKSQKENEIKEKAAVETVKTQKSETVTIHIASLKPKTEMSAKTPSEPSANVPLHPKPKIAQPEAQLILLECQNLILRFMLGEKERKLKISKESGEGEIEDGQGPKNELPNQKEVIEEVDEDGSDEPELKSQLSNDPPDDPKMKPHAKTSAVCSQNSESSMDPHSIPKPVGTKAAHATSSTGGTPLSCSSFEERVERSEISTLQRLLNRKEAELSVVHDKCHRLENLLKELELKCKANLAETDC